MSVEVARAHVTIIPKSDGTSSQVINQIVNPIDSAVSAAGGKAGARFNAGLGSVLSGFVVPAAIIGSLAAVGKSGYDAYKEVEQGQMNVIQKTGATGEAAEGLIDVYKNVARNVVGDFDDIGNAVGELNTRLGLTDKDLQAAAEQMMKYAKVTGEDATEATKDVASMMRNVGIPTEELSDTLDKLTVAGQAAGVDVGKLANNITKYNAVMKQMGLSTDEQIALMSKFEQSGTDTATILNAMKKGVAAWAKEGKDAKTEFANFVQGVQDGSVTAGDAVELFGSKGGLSMYEAAQKGQLSFEEMFAAISNSSGALDQVYNDTLTSSDQIGLAWQNIKIAMADVFAPLATGLATVLTDVVVPAVQNFSEFVGEAMKAVKGFFDKYIKPVYSTLKTIFSDLPGFFSGVWTSIQNTALNIWSAIKSTASSLWEGVKNAVMTPINAVSSWLSTTWESIKNTASNIWNGIKSTASSVWGSVKTTVMTPIGTLKTWLSTTWQSIKSTASNVWEGIKSAIMTPISAAKDFVYNMIEKIKGFFNFSWSLPHLSLPHISISGKFSLSPPSVPHFSIDWYRKAYENPYLFTQPTIIGNRGFGDGGGSGEILYGRDQLLRDIAEAKGGNNITVNVYASEGMSVSQLVDEVENRLALAQRQQNSVWGIA